MFTMAWRFWIGVAVSLLINYQWSREEIQGYSHVGNCQEKEVSITKEAAGLSPFTTMLQCLPRFARCQQDLQKLCQPGRRHRALSSEVQEEALVKRGFQHTLPFNLLSFGNPDDLSKVTGAGGSAEQWLADHCPKVIVPLWFKTVYLVLKELLCFSSRFSNPRSYYSLAFGLCEFQNPGKPLKRIKHGLHHRVSATAQSFSKPEPQNERQPILLHENLQKGSLSLLVNAEMLTARLSSWHLCFTGWGDAAISLHRKNQKNEDIA